MSTSAFEARSCVAISRPTPEESTNGTSPRSRTSSRGLSASTRSSTGSSVKVADMSRSPERTRSTPSERGVSSMLNPAIPSSVPGLRGSQPAGGAFAAAGLARSSRGQPGLLEVQVALDQPLDVRSQPPVVAQAEQHGPLDADQLAAQVRVAPAGLAHVAGAVLVATAQHGLAGAEAPPVELPHPAQLLLGRGSLVLELVEAVQRGLRRLQPRDRLVGRPRPVALHAQEAQERRQREPLPDERDQDHDDRHEQ